MLSAATLAVWWMFRQRAELARLRAALSEAQKRPPRFQDECVLDPETGMYRHKTKPGFFCAACAAGDDKEVPMTEEKDGWGWRCPLQIAHFVRGPKWRYPDPIQPRDRWRI